MNVPKSKFLAKTTVTQQVPGIIQPSSAQINFHP